MDNRFFSAVLITGILNFIAMPLLLRGYEIGEFSSVFSMILLTPVFTILTSFIFLGERANIIGIGGIILTIVGLWTVGRTPAAEGYVDGHPRKNNHAGNLYGIIVALIFSVSVNFDKLAIRYSDIFFFSASVMALLAILNAFYLASVARLDLSFSRAHQRIADMKAPMLLGVISAFAQIAHAGAISSGLVSYTLAIKRTGIIFGILWGWLFFHEKNARQKLLGILIAFCGIGLILVST